MTQRDRTEVKDYLQNKALQHGEKLGKKCE